MLNIFSTAVFFSATFKSTHFIEMGSIRSSYNIKVLEIPQTFVGNFNKSLKLVAMEPAGYYQPATPIQNEDLTLNPRCSSL